MSDKNFISIREFARRVGCSDTNIRKAIAKGKIVKGYVGNPNGHGKINYDVAFKEWSAGYDPSYPSNDKLRAKMMATIDKQVEAPVETPDAPAPAAETGNSINSAKRAQAIFKAKLLEIDLKERQGKLIDKQMAYKEFFEAGQQIRQSVMAVADRSIDAVYSAKTRNEAHTILTQALIDALLTLSDIEQRDILR